MSHLFKSITEIPPRDFNWLWEGWIPKGEITIIEGDPGTGKSTVLNFALSVMTTDDVNSIGRLPDYFPREPQDVLIIDTEQDIATTLHTRLTLYGADFNRITVADFDFADTIPNIVDELAEQLDGQHCDLVVVDALFDIFDIDQNSSQQVREALSKLRTLARQHDLAIVGVRHRTKSTHHAAINKGSGSVKIGGLARSVLSVSKMPNDPHRRIISCVKSNNGKMPKSLIFSIEDSGIVWHGISEMTADQLLIEEVCIDTRLGEATIFLKELLKDGPMPSKDVLKAAQENGISERTLNRCKRPANVKSRLVDKQWILSIDVQEAVVVKENEGGNEDQ